MEIEKLKVAELRSELSARGLDSKGTKPILVARLKEAIQSEESVKTSSQSEEGPPQGTPLQKEKEEMEEEEEEEEEAAAAAVEEEDRPSEEEEEEEDTEMREEAKESNGESPFDKKEEDKGEGDLEAEEEEGTENEGDSKEKKELTPKSNRQQRRGVKRKMNEDEPFVITEDEPEIPENVCLLDWYNSDLHLIIDKGSFLKGEPLFKDGWGYVWAGVKATNGFSTGKVAFQVKCLENMDSKLEDETDLHELRIGFSTSEPSMQLGESKHSFSYGGSGKKGTDSQFEEYGEKFGKGDVVGAYLDMTSDEVKIKFTKNETTLDEAFSFSKSELEGKALFPHISTRNIKFEVNFGASLDGTPMEPWFPLLPGYDLPSSIKESERGPARIPAREECEMIMMIGLPASGKTTWVTKHVEENPDKRYYVIGTTSLIDKMKVNGVCRRTSHTGRKDVLIQKCTRCLQDWLRLASQRRRNIIIDQTNVYPNAQKRKVRPFEGMIRKAVVVVPSDEEYKARAEAQEKAENKDVPDSAVMEMKANFSLPVEGGLKVSTKNSDGEEETKEVASPFKEIIFAHLNREEAQSLIEEYNKDAKEKGYGKKIENKAKRARGNNFRRGRSIMRPRRGGRGFGTRGFRGPSNGRRFMRGMHQRRGGGPPHPPPPPMRGFMPPRGPMQFNRGNRNQVKFGKSGGRSNWGQDSSPWSQWQQPNRPTGWGHWNQGNQSHHQNWGSQGNNRNHHHASFNHHQGGYSSGSGNSGVGGSHWNSNSSSSGWNNSNSSSGGGGSWGGSGHSNSSSSGWNNNYSNSSSGWNQGSGGGNGGGGKWSNNSNQGYPGNSYWGGGGYGGR